MKWLSFTVAWLCMMGCASAGQGPDLISLEDLPGEGIIRVRNQTSQSVNIYYTELRHFGPLQMLLVRFRDSRQQIIPIDGAQEGWFTPKLYSSDLGLHPFERITIPAGGTLELARDLAYFANATRTVAATRYGPCEVQIKLSGYLDEERHRPIEAISGWNPGPCPT